MTPEQVNLLFRKCSKRRAKEADFMRIAIGCAFGNESPSTLLDKITDESRDGSGDLGGEMSPKTRRAKKYGKWLKNGMDDYQLIEWLIGRKYDITRYYTKEELDRLGIEREVNDE